MKDTYKKEFAKDNLITLVTHALISLKGFIVMPLIIKFVGINIYGGAILIQSMTGLIFGISSFGIGIKMKRYLPSVKGREEKINVFYKQFYFRLIIMLIIFIPWYFFFDTINSAIFKNEIQYSFWIIPAFLITYFLYSQGSDYFRYTSRISKMSKMFLTFPVIYIAALIFLATRNSITINSIITAQSGSALLVAIPAFIIIRKELGIKWVIFYRNIISEIKIGFPLVLTFIMDFILAGIDRYIIAVFLSVSAVGNYDVGYKLGSLMILFPKAMGTVLPQLMSKAVDANKENQAPIMVNFSIKFFLLLVIPFIFGSIILGKPIMSLLANEGVASRAVLVLPIVALGTLFFGLYMILSDVLFVHLKTKQILKINLIAAIINIIANLILFYFFRSIIVAAITTFFSYLIAFLYIRRIVDRLWKIDYQIKIIFKSVIASLVMIIMLSLITMKHDPMNSVLIFAGEVFLGTIVYCMMLFFLKTLSDSEINTVKNFFRFR